MTDGREIRPPPVAAIPSPPKWFCDLSPKQRELWDALRQNPKAAQDFLDTNPSDDARLALQAPDLCPEQSYNWRSFPPSETGASFEDLALFQLLKAETPVSRQFWRRCGIALLTRRRSLRRRSWSWRKREPTARIHSYRKKSAR